MNENKWTRANRRERVTDSRIDKWEEGSIGRPLADNLRNSRSSRDHELLSVIEKGDPIWVLVLQTRLGLSESSHMHMYPTFAQAQSAQDSMPPGSEYGTCDFLLTDNSEFEVENLSPITFLTVQGMRGEAPYALIYDALHGSGVYDGFALSKLVRDWVGEDGKEWLLVEFGENWEAVAALEYCNRHFPQDSMATHAARILVSEFVAGNDFDAGFASAELKFFESRAEELALAAAEAQAKRNKGSGDQSAKAKLERVDAFLCEVEKLADIAGRISCRALLNQAWSNLAELRDDTPATLSTRQDYETIVRCDPPFKDRFDAVFIKNA